MVRFDVLCGVRVINSDMCIYDLWCAVLFCTRCAVLHYLAMGCGRRYIPCLVQDVVLYWKVR